MEKVRTKTGQGQGQDHLLPQRSEAPQFLVLALTLTLVLRFFNYRVVPDIPSLIGSLEIGATWLLRTIYGKSMEIYVNLVGNFGF